MAVGAGGYAAAITGGIDLMTGASADAAYEAAYGTFYSAFQGMHNAANQKAAAEANIGAIKQDRINTDMVIAMQQDQAEAAAKVSAAVSGVEGQSVNAVLHQTEVNSSVAQSNNRKNAEQQIENQLASIYQSQSTMLALDNPQVQDISMGRNLASSIAGIATTMGPEMLEGMDGLFGVTSEGTGGDMAINYQSPDMSIQIS